MATPSTMRELGTEAPDFALPDTAGGIVRRDDVAGSVGLLVAFICNHCPYVIHLQEALAKFAVESIARGIGVVAINANDPAVHGEDAPDKMAAKAREAGYTFPYLYDATQETAKAYGAVCTPDFFLYDANFALVYRGRFDSTRPNSGTPTGSDLRAACDALVAGDPPSSDQKPSVGCSIKWRPGNAPTDGR